MKDIFNWKINQLDNEMIFFHKNGFPFVLRSNCIIDGNEIYPEILEKSESLIEEVIKQKTDKFYLQRMLTALGDIIMLIPVVRHLNTLGYYPWIRTHQVLVEFLRTFGIDAETYVDFVKDKSLGIIIDGIVERDHWDKRVQKFHRVDLLIKALGIKELPEKYDWEIKSTRFSNLVFQNEHVIFQGVGPSPRRSLSQETAEVIINNLINDGINVVVLGEPCNYNIKNKNKCLLRFRQDTLFDLVSWIKGANCVITTDSAPLWISHLTKTPVICLLGSSREEERLIHHPLYPEKVVAINLSQKVHCSPCFELSSKCNHRYDCMKISGDEIYNDIRPFILDLNKTKNTSIILQKIVKDEKDFVTKMIHSNKVRLAENVPAQGWFDDMGNVTTIKPGEIIPEWVLNKYCIDKNLIHPASLRLMNAFEFASKHKGMFSVAITRDMNGRGDVLIASVIAKALKYMYGEHVMVYFCVQHGYERILEGNPWVDKIFTNEGLMFAEKPDIKLNVNDMEFRFETSELEKQHQIKKNRTSIYLEQLGLFVENKTPIYVVKEEERLWAKAELRKYNYRQGDMRLIGIQLYGSNSSRTYPYMEDVAILLRKKGYEIFYLDKKNDSGKFINNLWQFAALIEQCDMIISSNTSALHFAGAMKKRAVVIFGSEKGTIWTEDYEKILPCEIDCIKSQPKCWWKIECNVGNSLREKELKGAPPCLTQISPDLVVQKVDEHFFKPKRILIGILTWNLLELTKRTIDSIRSFHNYDIFIIDNESTDGTQEWLRENRINFISKKFTVPEAWNILLKKAYCEGYDYLLLCNNDILLSSTYIDTVIDVAERREAFAVTGRVFNRDEATLESFSEIVNNVETPITTLGSGDFSALLISKECIKKLGGFDVSFYPRYQSDEDYNLRLRLTGHEIIKTFATSFYHLSGAVDISDGKGDPRGNLDWERNKIIFRKKWGLDPYTDHSLLLSLQNVKKINANWNEKIYINLE